LAKTTVVQMTDDIDGSEASQSLHFSLDGLAYEIDLNDDNAESLRSKLGAYIGAARKVGGSPSRSRRSAKTWSQNLAACRCSWLKRL